MKIFKVDFDPVYPVGCGLIIAAETIEQAKEIAQKVVYTSINSIEEVDISSPKIIYFSDGNY